MIDVNDLGQIVWPVCLAMRVMLTRPPRWRLATRQDGSNRGEEIAPVKAGREVLRLPVDVPSARVCGAALDQLEQAVAGADVPAAIGFENNGWPRPANPGFSDAEIDALMECGRTG
jgi:hypothetical protein